MTETPEDKQDIQQNPPPPGATGEEPEAAPNPTASLPTSEDASRMAADMLNSAIGQKNAIASSFEAQRMAALEAVNTRRNDVLNSTEIPAHAAPSAATHSDAQPAAGGAQGAEPAPALPDTSAAPSDGPAGAPASSGPQPEPDGTASSTHTAPSASATAPPTNDTTISTRDLQMLLNFLNTGSLPLDQAALAVQLVDALKTLIAQEVRTQLKAALNG